MSADLLPNRWLCSLHATMGRTDDGSLTAHQNALHDGMQITVMWSRVDEGRSADERQASGAAADRMTVATGLPMPAPVVPVERCEECGSKAPVSLDGAGLFVCSTCYVTPRPKGYQR